MRLKVIIKERKKSSMKTNIIKKLKYNVDTPKALLNVNTKRNNNINNTSTKKKHVSIKQQLMKKLKMKR